MAYGGIETPQSPVDPLLTGVPRVKSKTLWPVLRTGYSGIKEHAFYSAIAVNDYSDGVIFYVISCNIPFVVSNKKLACARNVAQLEHPEEFILITSRVLLLKLSKQLTLIDISSTLGKWVASRRYLTSW